MPAAYANKFRVEVGDVGRIVFVDERPPPYDGGPKPQATAAEVAMTVDNLRRLHALIGDCLDKVPKK